MKMTELLEKDKDKLLTELSAAGVAEKAIPVLERETDRLLISYNERADSDMERNSAAHMMQAVRLALPFIDCIGYTKVWERGRGRSDDEDSGGITITSLLLLLAGLALLGFGFGPLALFVFNQMDSSAATDFLTRCAATVLGAIMLYISGLTYGRPKGATRKEYQVDLRIDADRIYRTYRTVMLSVDQSLEEVTLARKQAQREQAGMIDGRPATTPELELFSDLLAAAYSADPEYVLEKIEAIKYYLHCQQIDVVDYSEATKQYFDMMPGAKPATIRPAMVANGLLLKKGLASGGR